MQTSNLNRRILAWYGQNKRDLPWRTGSGQSTNPYHIWISEIMLQQTVAETVIPYFISFIDRWPTIEDLANTDLDSVLHAWQGLGYYARARNLYKTANMVVKDWNGYIPRKEDDLLKLPGIGSYTASAIIAIAYDQYSLPLDANIERVISRIFSLQKTTKVAKNSIKLRLAEVMPKNRYRDFVQALMDIGAIVCKVKNPRCEMCPCKKLCKTFLSDLRENNEYTGPKKIKPELNGVVFWITREDGSVFIRRREESGLLGGMMEFPSTKWRREAWDHDEASKYAPTRTKLFEIPGLISHSFSHFNLNLRLVYGISEIVQIPNGIWVRPSEFKNFAFPTVMKKVFSHYKSNNLSIVGD